jgi:hypothetical protein
MWHRLIREPWVYWKGRDHDLILHPVSTFTWRGFGEPRKTARVTDLSSKIWIRDLPNMKDNCHSIDLEFLVLGLRYLLWIVNKFPRVFLGHFFSYLIEDVNSIILYLRVTKLAEAVSVRLRDVNWAVGVLCCCEMNAIHQHFSTQSKVDTGFCIKVEEMQFVFTGMTIVLEWKHGSSIFYIINRARFRVSVGFVISQYVSFKTELVY